MDVDSQIEPMECDEIQADETFENRDLAFITHWRLATEHFEMSFYGRNMSEINKIEVPCAHFFLTNTTNTPPRQHRLGKTFSAKNLSGSDSDTTYPVFFSWFGPSAQNAAHPRALHSCTVDRGIKHFPITNFHPYHAVPAICPTPQLQRSARFLAGTSFQTVG
jgi:hypothetical protein